MFYETKYDSNNLNTVLFGIIDSRLSFSSERLLSNFEPNYSIKSILATLSIEGNCLDEKRVSSIMNGKLVISSPRAVS